MNSRRNFLQKLAASVIAFPLLSPEAISSMEHADTKTDDGPPLRVAIMGLGSYGTRVAEAMKDCKRARLTGVVSGTPAKITNWQTKYNIPEKNCYSYETFDTIKDNPEIDVVYVTTPNGLH